MSNCLTDREIWQISWRNFKPFKIPKKHYIDKYLTEIDLYNKKFIEIGGFPGTMSAYIHKKYKAKVFFIDFFIDKKIILSIEKMNNIEPNSIKYKECDFFEYITDEKFDLVYSHGFIEHFIDIKDVIQRHIDLLAKNGNLIILVPNFKGINGFIQKKFDRQSYDIHNVESMDMDYLRPILNELDLQNIKMEYLNKPMLWLSKQDKFSNIIIRKFVKIFSYLIKIFPFRSKLLSPFIVITAQKI